MKRSIVTRIILFILISMFALGPLLAESPRYPELYAQSVQPAELKGRLDNGLSYAVSRADAYALKTVVTLRLPYAGQDVRAEERGVAELLRRVTWHGPDNMTAQQLAEVLWSFSPVSPNQDWGSTLGNHIVYRLEVDAADVAGLERALHLLSQIVFQPALLEESIEWERDLMLRQHESGLLALEGSLTELEVAARAVANVDVQSLYDFYDARFVPQAITVEIDQAVDTETAVDWIVEYFSGTARSVSENRHAKPSAPPLHTIVPQTLAQQIMQARELGLDSLRIDGRDYVIIDGKILLPEPGLLEQRGFGRLFGAATALGGSVASGLAAVFTGPWGLAGLAPSWGVGSFYLLGSYDRDPAVVAEQRRDLLKKSFTQACKHRVGAQVLTPHELRERFIAEFSVSGNVKQLQEHLEDQKAPLQKVLNPEEQRAVAQVVRDYKEAVDQSNHLRWALDQQLKEAVKVQEATLEIEKAAAEKAYHEDLFVRMQARLQKERDEAIRAAKKRCDNALTWVPQWSEEGQDIIALRDEEIADAKADYAEAMAPEVEQGLAKAKQTRTEQLAQAQKNYQLATQKVRQDLKYDEEVARLAQIVSTREAAGSRRVADLTHRFRNNRVDLQDYLIRS